MKTTGDIYEQQAVQWIEKRGVRVLNRNFRRKTGEIDIIAVDGEYLVFIEVRSRAPSRFAVAAATVDRKKQLRLVRTAQLFLQCNTALAHRPCRFDVIAFESGRSDDVATPQWIRGAFTA